MNFETVGLGNGNVVGVGMDIGVRLDSESSFCALVENGKGGDGYSPRGFACPSKGPKSHVVRVRLAT